MRKNRSKAPKQAFDVLTAGLLLLMTSPLLVVIALIVRIRLGSPVIFRQTRPGLNGRPFTMFKFRTMRLGAGPDSERLTPIGRFLRASSLDEVPELINVLRGQMSLVGPRPLLTKYLDYYSAEQRRRHEVLPGITGWAQINGRNDIGWNEKLALDTWYVDHQRLWLDTKILGLTMLRVLTCTGINRRGYSTAPEFMGEKESPSCSAVERARQLRFAHASAERLPRREGRS
jgi:lipopolysaccharide/colanic/teichoic acid biosynthesis glycosyltransferase